MFGMGTASGDEGLCEGGGVCVCGCVKEETE